jgi:hypothetical protein
MEESWFIWADADVANAEALVSHPDDSMIMRSKRAFPVAS